MRLFYEVYLVGDEGQVDCKQFDNLHEASDYANLMKERGFNVFISHSWDVL